MATAEEIRQIFLLQGISVADWARERGFPAALVYRVLRGEAQCRRGQTHRIGVALGILPAPNERQRDLIDTLQISRPAAPGGPATEGDATPPSIF